MPSVTIIADELFALLGQKYTDDEINDISMNFGVEVDDVEINDQGQKTYKFDVAANRYDLLCVEGLARALRSYIGLSETPDLKINTPKSPLVLTQDPSTLAIRPFVVAAVLRNVNMNQAVYNSFIDLQDKLHFNIGRRRTLVSIGTHDLDSIQGPFTYTAKPYNEIEFTALSETKRMNVNELFAHYKAKEVCHLKPYLDIAEQPQVKAGVEPKDFLHPVIYDARGEVLSLPPVINSEYSKISLNTKNIFIEITATDFTKCNIVLNIITSLFSEHSQGENQFTVETVLVNHPSAIPFPPGVDDKLNVQTVANDTKSILYPNPASSSITVSIDEINKSLGLSLTEDEICQLLNKMQHTTQLLPGDQLVVTPPPTRSDILHSVDVQEDVAIAYGYNNLPQGLPPVVTIGGEETLNQLSNHLRYAVAGCGYIEVMTWALIQTEENFEKIHHKPNNTCVTLANSKTEFTACRTTLLPGLLKVVCANNSFKLPIQIFELGDVVLATREIAEGAINRRHLGVLYGGQTSGFEEVHGVLTRVMDQLRVPFTPFSAVSASSSNDEEVTLNGVSSKFAYTLMPIPVDDVAHPFLPKRGAAINLYIKTACGTYKPQLIGQIGVLHPKVMANFDVNEICCSMFEINIEPLL
eukprot:UN01790